jgi:hypothetical protein
MGKEEPGAFRVKVKVKEPNAQKGKPRKAQRPKPKAPKAPQHRSLMEALKQVAPPSGQGGTPTLGRLAEFSEHAKAAASHPPANSQGDPGSPSHAGPAAKAPGFLVPPLEVEEAEVEIVHLDPEASDRHR